MMEHRYSTFALDVYWAGDRAADRELAAHVAECELCRVYLAGLEALDAAAPRPAPVVVPRRVTRFWMVAAAAAFAIAIVGVAWTWRRDKPIDGGSSGYVAAKSAPAVEVLVRRDGQTHVWDGRSPVRSGDALALRVACEGMARVSVLAMSATVWARVSEGACPTSGLLPFTLVVDAEPGEEHAAVVFSRIALDENAARIEAERRTRGLDVWTLDLVFPKSLEASP